MDTIKRNVRREIFTAYQRAQHKSYRRTEPYHLSPVFDVVVCVLLLVAVVGYLTA